MRMRNPSLFCGILFVVLGLNQSPLVVCNLDPCKPIPASDKDVIEFLLNFRFLSAEIFLHGALGKGLDEFDPSLANGGPPPIGAERASLDPVNRRIIEEFGYKEIDMLRVHKKEANIQRPSIDLRKPSIAKFVDQALGLKLMPPFNPYANTLNFFLIIETITYNGMVGLVGGAPNLNFLKNRELLASLLGIQSGQNTVMRSFLYRRAKEMVVPYNITVAEFSKRTAAYANELGKCGIKEEGVEVPRSLGAAGLTESNVLSADNNSLSYSRTPQELLRVAYATGDESKPGGYFPNGANGNIAKILLRKLF